MKERPILFSGEMVRAILQGRKTQTRRVVKPQPESLDSLWPDEDSHIEWWNIVEEIDHYAKCGWCPYGRPGDRLWVREAWGIGPSQNKGYEQGVIDGKRQDLINYRAEPYLFHRDQRWRPSIFMPRWASRITLEVTAVRVERVQDITVIGAIDEGIKIDEISASYVGHFRNLWDTINGKRGYSWEVNPWVWVVKFKQVQP